MNITGIEELREAIRYCGITKELYGEKFQAAKFKLMKVATPELLSSILDQLEAERQRADDAEHAKRNQYRDLVAGQEVQKQLEAELAALKAKLANQVKAVEHWNSWADEGDKITINAAGFTVKGE